ncbi:MAG: signal peptidase I [Actinomycetia bacterium]|nr:signal peptidase I [Actinomycetes bacterium]
MSTRRTIAGLIGITAVSAAVMRGLTRRFEIKEVSMSPALLPGDWVAARRRTGVPGRGDIVIFVDPTGSGMNLVKRAIGLPGEEIRITQGRVTVDGAVLADKWAQGSTSPDGVWAVPDGHVWVLGDNRGASTDDGRHLGPIAIDNVHWIVVARYWPASRISLVS